MVWTGQDLVLLGIEHVPSPGSEKPSVYRAAILDLANGTWRRLPDSQIVGYNPDWFWSSGRVVNPTLGGGNGGRTMDGRWLPRGGLLDPTTGAWSLLPDPPTGLGGLTGFSLGGGDHVVNLEGWVLNVATSSWTALPTYGGEADSGQSAVWAGDRVVVFGGSKWSGNEGVLLDDAWTWRPS
jgi:hypothetical protein